ncbi:MAG: ParB/RepB/Spo0J family partition protein [Boseongicola sp.]|nr:MAG: ParB/RepB/Spo0J family partition protein [Boseongicola sp.]
MAQAKSERRGLGRGLSALMADVNSANEPSSTSPSGPKAETLVPLDQIVPNPNQPRRAFAENALKELTASVREKGIIQPLILRKGPDNTGKFEIVAGERRWRAAQQAQIHKVPAIIRELDDIEVLEIAIIENIQRADLNPVEEAAGYRQLMDRFGHTQEKLSEAMGKSRSHIANLMRLLTLPEQVLEMLQDGRLAAGHARALITASDPLRLALIVTKKGLSVRQTESLVKNADTTKPTNTNTAPAKDADTKAIEADLAAALGMRVAISHQVGAESGSLSIKYKNLDELDEICRRLSVTSGAGKV